MRLQYKPSYEFERQRWANERGWTREIFRSPATGPFDWRLSIAEIDHDCSFSRYPAHDRVLVLLHGAGIRLRIDDGRDERVLPPHGRIEFPGAAAVDCDLIDGPVRAFNLIFDPVKAAVELLHRPLVGPMVFFDTPRTDWLIYLAQGHAELRIGGDRITLATGDALHLGGDGSDRRAIVDGGGELLLVRISPRPD
jgi:uncharacterized protein